MIQLPILLSLAVGGLASAVWREYKQVKTYQGQLALSGATTKKRFRLKIFSKARAKPFDDVAEITHYQRVSWYSLAFSASGIWFYPPVALISLPLLYYNAYYFLKTQRQSPVVDQKSAMSVFETISLAATLLTGRVVMASVLMLLSFGIRKLQLQGGNMANIDLARTFNPQLATVWILRGESEIEVLVDELQHNDTIVLHAGDTVITEGVVMDGSGIIRQYSLQKKMKSLPKRSGDKVFPFTYLESGCLYIKAI